MKISHWIRVAAFTTLTAGALPATGNAEADADANADADADADAEDPNVCTHVRSRHAHNDSGYSHIVQVSNTCTALVKCHVWTNMDEDHNAMVDVPSGAQRRETVREGSPVSAFKAMAECHFEE